MVAVPTGLTLQLQELGIALEHLPLLRAEGQTKAALSHPSIKLTDLLLAVNPPDQFNLLRAEGHTQVAWKPNAVVATVVTWRGRRPIGRRVRPSGKGDVIATSDRGAVDRPGVIMLRRAAKEADATALGETQAHLGMAAAIILINIGLSTLRLWPSALTRDIAILRRAGE